MICFFLSCISPNSLGTRCDILKHQTDEYVCIKIAPTSILFFVSHNNDDVSFFIKKKQNIWLLGKYCVCSKDEKYLQAMKNNLKRREIECQYRNRSKHSRICVCKCVGDVNSKNNNWFIHSIYMQYRKCLSPLWFFFCSTTTCHLMFFILFTCISTWHDLKDTVCMSMM